MQISDNNMDARAAAAAHDQGRPSPGSDALHAETGPAWAAQLPVTFKCSCEPLPACRCPLAHSPRLETPTACQMPSSKAAPKQQGSVPVD